MDVLGGRGRMRQRRTEVLHVCGLVGRHEGRTGITEIPHDGHILSK